MSDPRVEFIHIIRPLDPCDEVELVTELPSIQDGWANSGTDTMKWWFIETFLDADTVARMRRSTTAVDHFFARLSRLTGKPASRRLVRGIQAAVLEGWFPEAKQIAAKAHRRDPASVKEARAALLRHLEGRWEQQF